MHFPTKPEISLRRVTANQETAWDLPFKALCTWHHLLTSFAPLLSKLRRITRFHSKKMNGGAEAGMHRRCRNSHYFCLLRICRVEETLSEYTLTGRLQASGRFSCSPLFLSSFNDKSCLQALTICLLSQQRKMLSLPKKSSLGHILRHSLTLDKVLQGSTKYFCLWYKCRHPKWHFNHCSKCPSSHLQSNKLLSNHIIFSSELWFLNKVWKRLLIRYSKFHISFLSTLKLFLFLNDLFIYMWKANLQRGETQFFHTLAHSSRRLQSWSCADPKPRARSQEPEASSVSPPWVQGSKVVGNLLLLSQAVNWKLLWGLTHELSPRGCWLYSIRLNVSPPSINEVGLWDT